MSLKKFESNYGAAGKITAAQKLAEIMCERRSSSRLAEKFWNSEEWNGFYKLQIRHANALLKICDVGVVFEALDELRWVWSLATPKLKTLCIEKQKKVNKFNG